jgi:hypothetical protein
MSFRTGNLLVTGPNGFSLFAALSNISYSSDRTQATVTYRIDAPGGSWDSTENGTYSVALRANEVRDRAGAYTSAQTLGTFDIAVPPPAPASTDPSASTSNDPNPVLA